MVVKQGASKLRAPKLRRIESKLHRDFLWFELILTSVIHATEPCYRPLIQDELPSSQNELDMNASKTHQVIYNICNR